MKKIITLFVAALLLASCQGKYMIAKRKYNKGYYVSVNKSRSTKPTEQNKQEKLTIHQNAKEETVVEIATSLNLNEQVGTVAKENTYQIPQISIPETKSGSVTKTTAQQNTSSLLANSSNQSILENNKIKPIEVNQLALHAKKGGDTNLILLIILCFLWWLNLIAVYLKDGKDITLNFWVTLLLNLTFIGGVIFALLVVLDVVDLK